MKNGKCKNCGSEEIYRSVNGIISGDKQVYVRNLSVFSSGTNKMTYICANCGYYENYIQDTEILNKITRKWEKVDPNQ
jgi:predicted RNA-binding Zn-ribbon protein involved in translation (DUF1610 family)